MRQKILFGIISVWLLLFSTNLVQANASWPELRWLLEDCSSFGLNIAGDKSGLEYSYRVNHGASLRLGADKDGLWAHPAFYFSGPFAFAYTPLGWEIGYVNEDALGALELAGIRISENPTYFLQLLSGKTHLFLATDQSLHKKNWEVSFDFNPTISAGMGQAGDFSYLRYSNRDWSVQAGYAVNGQDYRVQVAKRWQLQSKNPFIKQDFEEVILRTGDQQRLYGNWYRQENTGSSPLVIVLNGFGSSKENLKKDYLATTISSITDVLVLEFRGHGKSTGVFTGTYIEPTDVRAALNFAQRQGYQEIILLGFSMGGTIAIKSAALYPEEVSGLITVSAPFYINYDQPAHIVQELTGVAVQSVPFMARNLFGLRIIAPEFAPDLDLNQYIGQVNQPMLVVHGSEDWLIPVADAYSIFDLAGSSEKKLVILEESFHSEIANKETYNQVVETILDWLQAGRGN
mgnify:CR=1 FL=1